MIVGVGVGVGVYGCCGREVSVSTHVVVLVVVDVVSCWGERTVGGSYVG
jgi:hypothetical protein